MEEAQRGGRALQEAHADHGTTHHQVVVRLSGRRGDAFDVDPEGVEIKGSRDAQLLSAQESPKPRCGLASKTGSKQALLRGSFKRTGKKVEELDVCQRPQDVTIRTCAIGISREARNYSIKRYGVIAESRVTLVIDVEI